MNRYKRKLREVNEKAQGILVEAMSVEVTEDDYEKGEVGKRQSVLYEKNIGTFKTIEEVWKACGKHYTLPKNLNNFYAFEPGRITGSITVNENNEEPSSAEMSKWKKGEITLYTASIDIYVKLIEWVVPSEDTMAKMFKIPRY
jgi:hypothetical protein